MPLPARSNSTCQVSFSEPGLLRRVRDEEHRLGGIVARTARRGGRCSCSTGSRASVAGARRRSARRVAKLLVQRLEHAGGFLAAGHAEIQPLFLLRKDRVGIVLTVVAALAAVLLRHRRHHAAAQRPAFGELHALGERQRLVVPGRFVVIVVGRRAAGRSAGISAADCSGDSGVTPRRRARQAGEEAVEPGALLRRERRALRDELAGSAGAARCSCDRLRVAHRLAARRCRAGA